MLLCTIAIENVTIYYSLCHTSVCAWVEELGSVPNNPVLLFKPQGELRPYGMNNVGKDDFILGIQTQFLLDMLCTYGHICICMDARHETNMYNFKSITLLVLDDFGEGIPGTLAITNREDATMLVDFLTAIKQMTGVLKSPRWFKSDNAEQYFNSWKGVFRAEGTIELLSAWHIDRSWRNAVKEHIATKEIWLEVYHKLRVLLMVNEGSTFRVLLNDSSYIDSHEKDFYTFFKANYCNRLEQRALWFRIGTALNITCLLNQFIDF